MNDASERGQGLADAERVLEREREQLAAYAMCAADSRGRRYEEPPARYRTCYQRDRDRIVHSTAFRRLEYKTQVFVNHEGDHYRTRLTHTLEVAQISRSIARVLRLNEDLVEGIALAHDLGHPPFGHAGEDALDELMAAHGGFNHNAHSLRMVDTLELRYPDFPGLNLSWEVRESTIKHGDHFAAGDLPAEFEPDQSPLLEAQLADIADSLAYTNHDIDDGLRSHFISVTELRSVELWCTAEEEVARRYPGLDERMLCARVVSHLIDDQVTDLIQATRERLERLGIDSIAAVRAHREPLVGFSEGMALRVREMKRFLHDRLYHHFRTLRMAEKAKRFIANLFAEYIREPRQLPPAYQHCGERESYPRAICDYIAGMTDRYCQEEYQRLFYPFERL